MAKEEKMYIDLIPANCIDRKAFFREFRVFRLRFSPSCEMKVEKLNRNIANAYKKLSGSENISSLVYLSFCQGGGGFCAVRKGKKEEGSVKELNKLFEDLDLTLPRELSDHSFCECSYTSSENETESTRFPDTVLLKLILNIAEREMYAPEKAVWPLYVYCGPGRKKKDIVTMYLDVKDKDGFPISLHSEGETVKGYAVSVGIKTFHPYVPGKNIPKRYEKNPYSLCFTYDGSSKILGTSYSYKFDKNVYFEGPGIKGTRNVRPVFDKLDIEDFSYQKYGSLADLNAILKGRPRNSYVSRFLPDFQFLSLPSRREGKGMAKRQKKVRDQIVETVKNGTFPLNIYGEDIPETVKASLEKDYGARFSAGPVKGACNICVLRSGADENDEKSDQQYRDDKEGEFPVQHITLDILAGKDRLNDKAFEVCLTEEKIKSEIYAGTCDISSWMKEAGLLDLTGERTYILYQNHREKDGEVRTIRKSITVDYDRMKIVGKNEEVTDRTDAEFVIETPGKADIIISETSLFGIPDLEELRRENARVILGSSPLPGELIRGVLTDVRDIDPVTVDDILDSNDFSENVKIQCLKYHKQANGKLTDRFEDRPFLSRKSNLRDGIIKALEDRTGKRATLPTYSSMETVSELYPYLTDIHVIEDFPDMNFYYFVGSSASLKDVPRNILARKCTIEDGYELDEEEKEEEMKRAEAETLPLLYPMFVRSGQYTVLPMWAKYIRESMRKFWY